MDYRITGGIFAHIINFFDYMSHNLILSRMYKLKIFSQEFYIRTLLFILYSLRKYKRQLGIYTIFRYFNAELR